MMGRSIESRGMFTNSRLVSWIVAAVFGLVGAVAPAEAGAIKISDGTETLTITDQDFLALAPGSRIDQSAEPGVVVFIGSLGAWTFQLTSGITKPIIGSETEPIMEFHDVSLSSGKGGGTLTIWFSEVGFGPTGPVAESVIGGVADGKVKYETFKGTSLFDESTPLSSLSTSAGAFGSLAYASVGDSTGPYSLTQKATITHGGGTKVTSFDAKLSVASVPDGGMTLSLLGLGLFGIAGLRRWLP